MFALVFLEEYRLDISVEESVKIIRHDEDESQNDILGVCSCIRIEMDRDCQKLQTASIFFEKVEDFSSNNLAFFKPPTRRSTVSILLRSPSGDFFFAFHSLKACWAKIEQNCV